MREIASGSGSIIDSPDQAGGWPAYDTYGERADGDGEGMPDRWELDSGLNPETRDGANQYSDGDGYHNIEEYINRTDPMKPGH